MPCFEEGERVRVDIPDETDPDHERFHGIHGTVIDVLTDNAGDETGDKRDGYIFRVSFDDSDSADFRRKDLRPPIE